MSLGMTMGTFSIERVGIMPFLFWVLTQATSGFVGLQVRLNIVL